MDADTLSVKRLACDSHLQPLGGANASIFSSTPAGEHDAPSGFESVCWIKEQINTRRSLAQ